MSFLIHSYAIIKFSIQYERITPHSLPPSTAMQLQSLNITIRPVIYSCLALVSILNFFAGSRKSVTLKTVQTCNYQPIHNLTGEVNLLQIIKFLNIPYRDLVRKWIKIVIVSFHKFHQDLKCLL